MSKYNIRFFELVDTDSLFELFRELQIQHHENKPEFFNAPKSLADTSYFLKQILSDKNSEIIIAEYEGRIIGAIHIYLRLPFGSKHKLRKYVFVDSLVVKKGYRGFGIGKMLIEEAQKWGKDKDAKTIEVKLWEYNKDAIRYFRNQEFKTISRRLHKNL